MLKIYGCFLMVAMIFLPSCKCQCSDESMVRTISERYQTGGHQYCNLRWLADNWLAKGKNKTEVRNIFGENEWKDVDDENDTYWVFTGQRDEPFGNYLYIRFSGSDSNATVVHWEFASE